MNNYKLLIQYDGTNYCGVSLHNVVILEEFRHQWNCVVEGGKIDL